MTSPIDPRRMFRESALKRHLLAEDTDELLIIPPSYTRLAKFYIIASLFLLTLWIFFGALTIEVKGRAIFMSSGGIFEIEAATSGYVDRLLVKPGEIVKKDQPIILISDIKQELELKSATSLLANLEEDYASLKEQITLEEEKRNESLRFQIKSNEEKLKKLQAMLPDLERDYEKKKKLLEQGLVSSSLVTDTGRIVFQTRITLESTQSMLIKLKSNLKKSYRVEELEALESRVLQQREKKRLLELNREYIQLYSPIDSQILEILVKEGDIVTKGKVVVSVEGVNKENDKDNVIYSLVYKEIGKRIQIGSLIFFQPSSINSQEFGSLMGKVVAISPYAVSSEELRNIIHSQGLIEYLLTGTPSPYLVTIEPIPDSSTISGFKWTSEKGPPILVSTGTVGNVTGVAFYERPIVRIFPFWRIEALINKTQRWFHSWFDDRKNEAGE